MTPIAQHSAPNDEQMLSPMQTYTSPPSITDEEFHLLSKLVYAQFGIFLSEKKRGLVVGRLQKILRAHRFPDFLSYYRHVVTETSGRALDELLNNISTNYTYFWREPAHFEHFRNEALPDLTARLKETKNLRIWCAAAATGEEPYMLAMILRDFGGNGADRWKAGLLATDISESALSVARQGIYTEKGLEKFPMKYRHKYFKNLSQERWSVVDRIKKDITFRRFNLMNPLPFKKKFHMVFLRNIMIYFDRQTKRALIERIYEGMEEGGYLYIGHSEAIDRRRCPFTFVMPALYRKFSS